MHRIALSIIFLFLVSLATPGTSLSRVDVVMDAGRERVAKEIEEQLIAPCCWRTPIIQHYSGAAEKMKVDLRQMLADGRTSEEIIEHYRAMYGERILSSPSNAGFNRMAYLFTPLMFLTGAGLIFFTLRRWRSGRMAHVGASRAVDSAQDARHRERIDAELKTYD